MLCVCVSMTFNMVTRIISTAAKGGGGKSWWGWASGPSQWQYLTVVRYLKASVDRQYWKAEVALVEASQPAAVWSLSFCVRVCVCLSKCEGAFAAGMSCSTPSYLDRKSTVEKPGWQDMFSMTQYFVISYVWKSNVKAKLRNISCTGMESTILPW